MPRYTVCVCVRDGTAVWQICSCAFSPWLRVVSFLWWYVQMAVDEWANGKLVLMDIYIYIHTYVYTVYAIKEGEKEETRNRIEWYCCERWNCLSPPIGYKVNSKSLMLTVRNALDLHLHLLSFFRSFFFASSIVLLHEVLCMRVCSCVIYIKMYMLTLCVCVCVYPVFQLNGVDLNCTVVTISKQIFSIER